MSYHYVIRKMTAAEASIAIYWALKQGWNPGLHDAHCFYQADPNGFFIGLLNDEPIATGAAVVYDDNYAFCGLYIVKEGFRGKGYGMELTKARLDYAGTRITGLDGVLDKVDKYARLGYVGAHTNKRYVWNGVAAKHLTLAKELTALINIPSNQLAEFDRKFFPASRLSFLQAWIAQEDSHSLAFMPTPHSLQGYGVMRKCHLGYKIRPLYATTAAAAYKLFEGLCSKIASGPVFLDIPECNANAVAMAKYYGMEPVFEVVRMYRNGFPDIDVNGIFGISTFELG